MTWLRPVELRGSQVSLVPLNHGHANDLVEALCDGELWKLWYTSIPSPDKLVDFIDQRLAAQAKGTLLPFAVLDNATGKAVGTTNYLNVDLDHRRLEIGGTWYRKNVQRSHVNTQCKLLLLEHAFETLLCIAVGRYIAQPSNSGQRNTPRYLRLQHYCQRVADCEGAPYVADGETKTARDSVKST